MQNRRQSIAKLYEYQEIQNFIKEKLDILMVELILPTVNISDGYRSKVEKKKCIFIYFIPSKNHILVDWELFLCIISLFI